MRGDVDVRRVPERVVGRERLGSGDVDDRRTEVAASSAAISAPSSTSEPRVTLQNTAPGFIAAKATASNMFSVSGVAGALRTTASQRPKTSWSEPVPNSSSQTGDVLPTW